MRFVIFTHSLVSDWNHGNAHFLRGIALELKSRGCQVRIFEPRDSWSRSQLLANHGPAAIQDFHDHFPDLRSTLYDPADIDLDSTLDGADVVLVHEWNPPEFVARIGEHRRSHPEYRLLFHDTHHRALTAPSDLNLSALHDYDGILAYGKTIESLYRAHQLNACVWTWHEAADTRTFYPREKTHEDGDLVWIGNWGDEERAEEIREFLVNPVRRLGLRATVYGVRYPEHVLQELASAGIRYRGWIPNYRVPEAFSRFRITVHIPRRPYSEHLPGIPTIRPFEAMACGIPLISAPWKDSENLFQAGRDYLSVANGDAMTQALDAVLHNPQLRSALAEHGPATIRSRHTCAHRVTELFNIIRELDAAEEAA